MPSYFCSPQILKKIGEPNCCECTDCSKISGHIPNKYNFGTRAKAQDILQEIKESCPVVDFNNHETCTKIIEILEKHLES